MKTKTYLLALILTGFSSAHGQWAVIDSLTFGGLYSVNFINADTGFVFNEWATLRKTVDGGQTWDTVDIPFDGFVYDIDFADANNGYAVGGAWFPFADYYAFSIMKTNDGGITWDSVYGNFNGGVFTNVEVPGPNEFYASGTLGVVHSTDGGATLDTLSVSNAPFAAESYSRIHFLNSNRGFVMGLAYSFGNSRINLYETNDGGQTWQSIFVDSIAAPQSDFAMTAAGSGVIVGKKGHIFKTVDGGATWQNISLGDTSVTLWRVEEVDGRLVAVGNNLADTTTGIYSSPDWGITWYKEFSMKSSQGSINDLSVPALDAGYFITWQEIFKGVNLTSVEEEKGPGFEIYPNPVVDFISVQSSGRVSKVILYNTLGQKIMEVDAAGKSYLEINVSSLKRGLYLMELQHAGESFTAKVLKQ